MNKSDLMNSIQKNMLQRDFAAAEYKLINANVTDNVLSDLKIVFTIFNTEKENNSDTLFFDYSLEVNNIVEHYIKLKFLLRRVEFDIGENPDILIIDYIKKHQISVYALIVTIMFSSVFKTNILNKLAVLVFNAKMHEMVIPLLQSSYNIDSENPETLLNFSYVLAKYGEYQLADKYLKRIKLSSVNCKFQNVFNELKETDNET